MLEKIFPVEQVQVVAPRASLLGKDITQEARRRDRQDDPDAPRGQRRALPRMSLSFPAFGRGDFEGNDLKFEVGGFADGIDPTFVRGRRSADPRAVQGLGRATRTIRSTASPAQPPPVRTTARSSSRRGRVRRYVPPVPKAPAPGMPVIEPEPEYYNPCPRSRSLLLRRHRSHVPPPRADRDVADDDRALQRPVREVARPAGRRHRLRQVRHPARWALGDAVLDRPRARRRSRARTRRSSTGHGASKACSSGSSSKAMPIGMTMPIQYIQRWNREFLGDEAATTYSSIIVTLKDQNEIAVFAQWLQDTLDLRLEDSLGEKFATVAVRDPARARPDLARHHRDQRDQHRPQLLHAGHRAPPRAGPAPRGRRDPDRRPHGRPRRGRR